MWCSCSSLRLAAISFSQKLIIKSSKAKTCLKKRPPLLLCFAHSNELQNDELLCCIEWGCQIRFKRNKCQLPILLQRLRRRHRHRLHLELKTLEPSKASSSWRSIIIKTRFMSWCATLKTWPSPMDPGMNLIPMSKFTYDRIIIKPPKGRRGWCEKIVTHLSWKW